MVSRGLFGGMEGISCLIISNNIIFVENNSIYIVYNIYYFVALMENNL